MKNKDALKKHHFWIMFGVVPLFVLIAVLVVSANVGDAIKKREDDIEAKKTAIKSKTNPKSNALLKKMDELIDQVKSKQDVLWGECYYPQKNIYSSEAMKSLVTEEARQDFEHKIIKPVEKLKFGAPINREDVNTQSELLRRSEFYADWYENLAKKIAPTTFAGSWKKQLRYVDSWTDVKLNSDQIWLMLEDMWVQKSLVEAIGSVNEQLADFQRIKFERNGQVIDDPDEKSANPKHPLRRKFKSRTWEVELEVIVEAGGKKYLKGRLINTTDKLQLLGVGNTMVLRVWLANGKDVSPFEFKINNEYVAGAGDSRGARRSTPATCTKSSARATTPSPPRWRSKRSCGSSRRSMSAPSPSTWSRTSPWAIRTPATRPSRSRPSKRNPRPQRRIRAALGVYQEAGPAAEA